MQKDYITTMFKKFEDACHKLDDLEFWSARDIMGIFNYKEWRVFTKLIDRAKKACEGSEQRSLDHFVAYHKKVSLGSGAGREIEDLALTRYACYLIAQNGDPVKPEIAFAQTYFAIQTRKQELVEQRLLDIARITAREKLSKSEKKLSGIIYERGVGHKSFAMIRSKGDQALYGGKSTKYIKEKLGVPMKRPLADFLPTLMIKAKDFASELTSHNVVDKDLYGDAKISDEHISNNKGVRSILVKRGVKPENLPADEDIKFTQRRIKNTEKQLLNDLKKDKSQ